MHYVQYIPGTIAHITEHKTRHGHADVNRLSARVCEFNDWLTNHASHEASEKVATFVHYFFQFQL